MANITADEVWVGVDERHASQLPGLREVRVVLVRPNRVAAWADTSIRRMVGSGGRVAALWRPEAWVADPRRAHGRVDLRLPAYLRQSPGGAIVSAWTTNVSVGGCQCATRLSLELGQRVEVSLSLSPVSSLECGAQVVRISDDPEDRTGKRVLVAFKFIELTEADQAQVAAAMAALDSYDPGSAVPRD